MNIYLACTVRGDRGAVEGLRRLVASLERDGHTILTKHLLDDDVDTAEASLSERAVYERDIEWLDGCDLLIADASGSSYGVGFEVGYVLARSEHSGQRVVLLYRRDRRPMISRLISGNGHPRCVKIEYDDASQLTELVAAHLPPKPL